MPPTGFNIWSGMLAAPTDYETCVGCKLDNEVFFMEIGLLWMSTMIKLPSYKTALV
jgi:hypothetical protein